MRHPGFATAVLIAGISLAHGLLAPYQVGRFEEKPRAFAARYRRSLKRFLRGLQP